MRQKQTNPQTKNDLLNAAMELMLDRGYNGTTVEQICKAAGVTKGSFFYYFKNKESLGQALLPHFLRIMGELLMQGNHQQVDDPLQRLYSYCDDIANLLTHQDVPKSCLIGNFAQELASTQPAFSTICNDCFAQWAQQLQQELDAACQRYPPNGTIDTYSIAEHFLAIFEGALILAKAQQDLAVVVQNLDHFKRYLELLFGVPQQTVKV